MQKASHSNDAAPMSFYLPFQPLSLHRPLPISSFIINLTPTPLPEGEGPKAATLDDTRISRTLDDVVARRGAFLTGYQNAAYAAKYRALVDKVRAAEAAEAAGSTALTEAVARYAFKLMAYKDEYEVARLYTDGTFLRRLNEQFEGDFKLRFHLAPPLVAPRDATTGHLQKRRYGGGMMRAFKLLAKLRFLRGTPFDVFGYTAERRGERKLVADYEALMDEIAAKLSPANHAAAVDLARIPERIRGYGHVKETNLAAAKRDEAQLLAAFRNLAPARVAAE